MFQFTHPVWGATGVSAAFLINDWFQFTHPVWGATIRGRELIGILNVSIHAPRVGCDQ